jgi:hypothetical protein
LAHLSIWSELPRNDGDPCCRGRVHLRCIYGAAGFTMEAWRRRGAPLVNVRNEGGKSRHVGPVCCAAPLLVMPRHDPAGRNPMPGVHSRIVRAHRFLVPRNDNGEGRDTPWCCGGISSEAEIPRGPGMTWCETGPAGCRPDSGRTSTPRQRMTGCPRMGGLAATTTGPNGACPVECTAEEFPGHDESGAYGSVP